MQDECQPSTAWCLDEKAIGLREPQPESGSILDAGN
jgi:hypothetical protein